MSRFKFFIVALIGWLGLLFTFFVYCVAIAGIIALF